MGGRRFWILAAVVCAALTAAGIAAAHRGATAVKSASATFDATTVSQEYQVTCSVTGGDTFQATRATYTGTATSSDPRLTGALTIRAWSLVDTSNGVGHVYGVFHVKGTDAGARGTLNAALANGNASGLARGIVRGPWGRLVASLGGTFDPSAGFTDSLGSATSGAGFIRSGRWCHPPHWPTN